MANSPLAIGGIVVGCLALVGGYFVSTEMLKQQRAQLPVQSESRSAAGTRNTSSSLFEGFTLENTETPTIKNKETLGFLNFSSTNSEEYPGQYLESLLYAINTGELSTNGMMYKLETFNPDLAQYLKGLEISRKKDLLRMYRTWSSPGLVDTSI